VCRGVCATRRVILVRDITKKSTRNGQYRILRRTIPYRDFKSKFAAGVGGYTEKKTKFSILLSHTMFYMFYIFDTLTLTLKILIYQSKNVSMDFLVSIPILPKI
jgi:hypothetical protein